ncbi:MAG: NAD-dependent epimerase/dehydratase family protein [Aggregatilineales bacterium]
MPISVRRALVTGANGFIGGALTVRLLEQGAHVRAMCRNPANGQFLAAHGAEVVEGDVQDFETVRRHAQSCDLVVHGAAVGSGSAAVQYRVNVQGAENVAQAAVDTGAARLVHISSVAVYGLDVSGAVFESHEQNPSPRDFYQQSKALGEAAVWRIARHAKLPTAVVRPAFVYGPHSSLWTKALYSLCQRLPVIPEFPGMAHPIYIDDLVDLLMLAADHPNAPGEAFNASADPAIPWRDFLGAYAQMAGKTRFVPFPARSLAWMGRPLDGWFRLRGTPEDVSGSIRFLGNQAVYRIDKAINLLGWQPHVSLTEGMAACERWLKGDRSV